jgi:hypothetical protein
MVEMCAVESLWMVLSSVPEKMMLTDGLVSTAGRLYIWTSMHSHLAFSHQHHLHSGLTNKRPSTLGVQ